MSVLRTLVFSALGGSVLHVSMRAVRGVPRSRARNVPVRIPVPDVVQIPARATAPVLIALQNHPNNAESDLVAQIRQSDNRTIDRIAELIQFDLDLRFSTLEQNIARQISDLNAIRDMTVQRDARIGEIARDITLLCERLSSPYSPLSPSPERGAAARFREQVREREEDERRSRMKAMFAFEQAEPQPEKRTQQEPREFTRCPDCRSSQTRPAHRLTWVDECLKAFALNAYRCRRCKCRFYHVLWGASIDLAATRRKWRSAKDRLAGLLGIPVQPVAHGSVSEPVSEPRT